MPSCERNQPHVRGPKKGGPVIEFTPLAVDGNPYTASELLKDKPNDRNQLLKLVCVWLDETEISHSQRQEQPKNNI
jgi:hypothetical protein